MRMGEKLQDLRKLIVNALILLLLGTGLFWAGTLVSNSGQTTTISQEEVYARRTRDFQRAVDLLYRNPSATSRHHVKAFQTLSALKQRREGKK